MAESKDMRVKVTVDEGQALLKYASGFGLPPKLGENSYNGADQALAAQATQQLYLELKSRSPLLSSDRRLCFGPGANWKKEASSRPGDNWTCINPEDLVEIKLSEDALSGAFWCLVTALHPSSPMVFSVGSQVEIGWPLAKKLRLKQVLEKEIGLATAKHRKLNLDPEEGSEESIEEELPEEVDEERTLKKV